jgi:serine protease Do
MLKRSAIVFALVTGVVLGATVLRDVLPISFAQTTPVAPVAPAPSSFNEKKALLENESNTIDITEANQDSVLFVSTITKPQASSTDGTIDPFGLFGNGQNGQGDLQTEPQQGSGSGFFVSDKGDILTNYHVVDGADSITIKMHSDKKEYKAKVIGTAPDYDLALIRVEGFPAKQIKAMKLGDSDALKTGRKVLAMGSPFGLDFTVTEGIVSATNREIPTGLRGVPQNAIQTDAAINPGNSGGPLLNSRGEVIGINTQIFAPSGRFGGAQNAGVGFAIPINVAKNILPRLEAGGEVRSPTLGIQTADLASITPKARKQLGANLPEEGIYVRSVAPKSPAEKAGLKTGDVVLGIGASKITAVDDLRKTLFANKFGDTFQLKILRDGKEMSVSVTLEDYQPQK